MKRNLLPLALLCAAAGLVHAQDANDGTLHVLRPIIHAEQEEAELCLEFDHDLDAANRGRIAAAIKLESEGKAIPLRPQNVSIAANLLCLPTPEHRREYRVMIGGVRGTKGEKLSSSYGIAFTVPDRKPALGFTGVVASDDFTRWQDRDPILRAINVPKAHLELYRITDPMMIAAAWRDRQQATLAPSESATFGHDHGQPVWSGDVPLDGKPNDALEKIIPLHDWAGNVPSGLYLLIARAPETKPVTDAEAPILPATGAVWLLRSDLRLNVLRDANSFYGLAEKADTPTVVKDVRLVATDNDATTLAEAHTDANGVGFVALGDKASKAASLIGFTATGDMDFADLSRPAPGLFAAPQNRMSLNADRPFYAPASPVFVTLLARDAQNRAVPASGSLALLWPDGGTFMNLPVPAAADGTARLSFVAPAKTGMWNLVWRRDNGELLAQSSLRVTDVPSAPRIEMTADHGMISRDGALNLTLKSLDADGKPDPYRAGQVFIAWSSPDMLSKEWKDYSFGTGASGPGTLQPLMSFVTDEKGLASLHLTLTPPDDHVFLHSAVLSVRSDAASPPPLTLPVKPKDDIIGIRPLAVDSRFPENSLARFAVVSLDADGHRHDTSDLAYQIYEEGRSFDWYQAEGRWNYRPQQQKRRIGGGQLTLAADTDEIIEWPVAAGSYRLEITDANGAVRAAADFSAGSGVPDAVTPPSPLALTPSATTWKPGEAIEARFTLDQPSVITGTIGDDHIRAVFHQALPAGPGVVSFIPQKDWSDHLILRVEADSLNLAGEISLTRFANQGDVKAVEAKDTTPVSDLPVIAGDVPPALAFGDAAQFSLAILNKGKATESWHYSLAAGSGVKLTQAAGSHVLSAAPGQAAKISALLAALHPGPSSVTLDIAGPNHFHVAREWTVVVGAEDLRFDPAIRQRIEPQQSTSWPPNNKGGEKGHAKDDSILFLSPASLYGGPSLLADILKAEPFTTGEIAGTIETLRLWHDVITQSELMPDAELASRQQNLLLRLLSRQNPDGGFFASPGNPTETRSDFLATAAALTALSHSRQAFTKPAADQAAQWLRQNLENAWFGENERPQRAAAFAALADSGRIDPASLHYFSDTSAQKPMPPLAAAQLALAFSRIGDQPASAFWIDRSEVIKNASALAAEILPVLAGNGFYDPQNLSPSFDDLSGKDRVSGIEAAANVLRALWYVQDRKGAWRVTVDTDKRSLKNILVIPVAAKAPVPVIHNTGDGPIFMAGVQKIDAALPASTGSIARYIYQLNGTEVGGRKPLARDATYLVVLEGPWPENGAGIVHDNPGPALRVAGCIPPPPIEAADSLAWLKSQTLTGTSTCEISSGAIDMVQARKDSAAKDNHAGWRVAYLAKAEWGGAFNLPPASVRAPAAGLAGSVKSSEDRIEIR